MPPRPPQYPNKEELGKHCALGNSKAVFYTSPARVTRVHAVAASSNGITVDRVFSQSRITKKKRTRNPSQKEIFASVWWEFVHLFSKVFADHARGDCILVTSLLYQPAKLSVWERFEFPVLKRNLDVKKVTCVDYRDNLKTEVIYKD